MSAPVRVPLGDLRRESAEIGDEIRAAVDRVLASGYFILGPEVAAFESEFAAYCGARYAVGLASGTDALILALAAAGVGPGDDVLTTTLTSVATAMAIVRCGARPVLVDVDPETLNLDLALVTRKITSRTRAIVPVHLYGRPVDMPELMKLAHSAGIAVIEDACQAHGAKSAGQTVGTFGAAGCFSFYPSKNLGGYGDGGMIVTNDGDLADRVRLLRQYGWRQRDRSECFGYNSRLDEMQAAILRVKLPNLDSWNQRRRQLAERYGERLATAEGAWLPELTPGNVFHLYVGRFPNRDALKARLEERGIATGIHYPIPVHRQPAFQEFGYDSREFPQAEDAVSEILTLPLFPQLREAEVDYVAEAVLG